ncbi:DinB family protein [Zeaxanthinibacter enoshimensis]|uniref:DinB family protein n=1 Tax=Zeaxanthinibacter enoshimensis TaxID=392009 RepID=UPI0035679C6F
MKFKEILIPELEEEVALTEKFLKRIPGDKLDWKPHTKSMTLRQLGSHLAEIPSWVSGTMETDEISMDDYKEPLDESVEVMVQKLRKNEKEAKASLQKEDSEFTDKEWRMLMGGKTIWVDKKYKVLRSVMNQLPHHRAQLGVYLRLLDQSVPATYGPSADEHS